jgi:peptidyl-prolyl cis-trans isomerase D
MAAILTIRKHSGIVIGFIGLAILAFVLTDAFQNNSALFSKGSNDVGEIAGQTISSREFDNRYQIALQNHKERNQTENVDEEAKSQILDQVWQQLVEEIVYGNEYESLGLVITPDELSDLVTGDNPHQWVVQSFTNKETGVFDKNQVIQILKNLDKLEPAAKKQWLEFEEGLNIFQFHYNLYRTAQLNCQKQT